MSVRLLNFVTSATLVAAAGSSAIPATANAQRWREVVKNRYMEGKLDMGSLRWNGSIVTYQVAYRKSRPGTDEDLTSLATSEMNCETHQRRLIARESPYPNGTVREAGGLAIWTPIGPRTLTAKIEQIICAARP